jgi:hypothetical protein
MKAQTETIQCKYMLSRIFIFQGCRKWVAGVADQLTLFQPGGQIMPIPLLFTVGFWCQTIHEKFLQRFDTIFGLKKMVKSGLEKIILKFNDGLQSCCCPVQKNLPIKAELAWQVSRYL